MNIKAVLRFTYVFCVLFGSMSAATLFFGLNHPLGAAGGYDTIQDEGSSLTQRTTLNFIGSSITCADNAGKSRTDCTLTGGGSTTIATPYVSNGMDFGYPVFLATQPTSGTWTNQGGGTLSTSTGAYHFTFPKQSGVSLRAYMYSIPSAPYTRTIAMGIGQVGQAGNNDTLGLCISDGTKFEIMGPTNHTTPNVGNYTYNNTSTFTGTVSNTNFLYNRGLFFLRINDDNAGNRTWSISNDAVSFTTITTEGSTTFLTPTTFGVCADVEGNVAVNAMAVYSISNP